MVYISDSTYIKGFQSLPVSMVYTLSPKNKPQVTSSPKLF